MAAGAALLIGWTGTLAAGFWSQSAAEARWEQLFDRSAAERPGQVPPPPALMRPVEGIDFGLRIPRLGYRAAVREGVSEEVLFGGPGHYPGTAWPGQPGTVGLAGHNVYWLRLDRLQTGDAIALDTRYGTFRYRVTGMRVVDPDDVSVLEPAPGRRLTLTTCWPLWAGQLATMRLAVFAA